MTILPLSDDPHGDYLSPPMPVGAYYADDVDYGHPRMCPEACGREADCDCIDCSADQYCRECCMKAAAA